MIGAVALLHFRENGALRLQLRPERSACTAPGFHHVDLPTQRNHVGMAWIVLRGFAIVLRLQLPDARATARRSSAGLRILACQEHSLAPQRLHLRFDVLNVALRTVDRIEVRAGELGQCADVLRFEGRELAFEIRNALGHALSFTGKELRGGRRLPLPILAIAFHERIDEPGRSLLGTLRIAILVADVERRHDGALASRLRVENVGRDDIDADVIAQLEDRAFGILVLIVVQRMRCEHALEIRGAQHFGAQALDVLVRVRIVVLGSACNQILRRLRAFDLDVAFGPIDVRQQEGERGAERDDWQRHHQHQAATFAQDVEILAEIRRIILRGHSRLVRHGQSVRLGS